MTTCTGISIRILGEHLMEFLICNVLRRLLNLSMLSVITKARIAKQAYGTYNAVTYKLDRFSKFLSRLSFFSVYIQRWGSVFDNQYV